MSTSTEADDFKKKLVEFETTIRKQIELEIISWLKMVGCPHVSGIEAGSYIPVKKDR